MMEIEEKKYDLQNLDGKISTRCVIPSNPVAMLVLAHGAGAGIDHQFMVDIQKELAVGDIASYSFNFLYRELGKRPPFRMTEPITTFVEIWQHVRNTFPDHAMFVAGKSYGGRVGSHSLNRLKDPKGLVFMGYPFHPPKKLDKLRTEHLYDIKLPMLFLQGTRDNLSTHDIATQFISCHSTAELVWLEDGDHSWKPRKKSGFSQLDHIKTAVSEVRRFCMSHS